MPTSAPQFRRFGIIGAGAWGTALAATLRRAGRDVTLWAHEAEVAATINARHENERYLKSVALDPAIRATSALEDLAAADVWIAVTPAQHLRETLRKLKSAAASGAQPVVIASKGVEIRSGKLLHDVAAEEMPGHEVAILSGPSFAAEVARGLPTALTLATSNMKLGAALQGAMGSPAFRLYLIDDVKGVELGGAVKNVLAVACGIVAGRAMGENARAALLTRGLAEMMRLGAALGAKPETLMGLSGLGDLALTCGSEQSRNMSLGMALGQGQKLADIMASRINVTEGVTTAGAALALAKKCGVDMPIVAAVEAVLNGADIDTTITALLARPQKAEGV